MSRQTDWEVRVAPAVDDHILDASRQRGESSGLVRGFRYAMQRLMRNGTRAKGAKKLKSIDLREIRVGDYRAYFCPVPNTNLLAVGALVVKRTKRHRAQKLRTIERHVHRWRDELKEES